MKSLALILFLFAPHPSWSKTLTWKEAIALGQSPNSSAQNGPPLHLAFQNDLKLGDVTIPKHIRANVLQHPGPSVQKGHSEWGGSGYELEFEMSPLACKEKKSRLETKYKGDLYSNCAASGDDKEKIGNVYLFYERDRCLLRFEVGPASRVENLKSCVSDEPNQTQPRLKAAPGTS